MMKTSTLTLGFLLVTLTIQITASPKLLPFQGYLTDSNGVAVPDGAKVVQFKIYDAPVSGTAEWAGEVHKLSVNKGLVNTILGTKTSMEKVHFDKTLYLEIAVDANGDEQITAADPPLLPRQIILPAVFASEAADSRKLAGHDWSVVFGTDSPSAGFINGRRLAPGSVTTAQLDPNVRSQFDPLKFSFPALESIPAYAPVAYARDTNKQVGLIQASASTASRATFFGFAISAANKGQLVTAQQYGLMTGFSSLKAGESYYLGTSQGTITNVYPSGVQQYVGHAMSESTLFIDPAGTSKSWAWAASGNYWGNRSDGELVTSGDVSFAVPVDGPVVVKQFSSLTINAGDTVTTANRCRGLVIYVEGDATINGTLTMTARGANVDPALPNSIPASGIRLARRKSGGPDAVPHSDLGGEGAGGVGPTWKAVEEAAAEIYPHTLSDGMIYVVARSGGIGGGRRGGSAAAGFSGNRGLNGTGGGGGGANDDPGTSGAGATGTCYSGGSGGGANHDGPGGAANAGANGGAGGAPSGLSNGGGAGNPSAANAETGTGGLLVIFVRGKLTVGSGGRVSSNGSAGGDSFTAGGGSGGGRVIVLYGGEFLKQGVIEASGGKGGTGAVWAWGSGGAGGDGEVTIDNIDP